MSAVPNIKQLTPFEWGYGVTAGAAVAGITVVSWMDIGKHVIDAIGSFYTDNWGRGSYKGRIEEMNNSCVVTILGEIDGKMASTIQRQLRQCQAKSLDVVIDSNGGNFGSACRIINTLTAFKGPIRTWVPYRAYSCAAFIAFCLTSKGELIAGKDAHFGSIDPIVGNYSLTGFRAQKDLATEHKTFKTTTPDAIAANARLEATHTIMLRMLDQYFISQLNTGADPKKLLEEVCNGDIDPHTKIISRQQLADLGVPFSNKPVHDHVYQLVENALPL